MAMDRDRDRVKLLSNRIERSELKPGDHIYTWRIAYTYAHHGIYIGDNKVVHFTRRPEDCKASAGCKACAVAKCQHQAPATDGSAAAERRVRISCLDCFVHKRGHLYLYAYGVSTMFFVSKSDGTCTMAHSDPPDRVLHRALYLLKHGYGKYNLINHNCEDFSIYCKTELVIQSYNFTGLSNQVQGRIARATVEMEGDPIIKFLGSEIARYSSDFGVRKDVTRVPVEMLVKGGSDTTGQMRQGVLKCLKF